MHTLFPTKITILYKCNKNGNVNWKLLHNNIIPCIGEIRLEECSAENINI